MLEQRTLHSSAFSARGVCSDPACKVHQCPVQFIVQENTQVLIRVNYLNVHY